MTDFPHGAWALVLAGLLPLPGMPSPIGQARAQPAGATAQEPTAQEPGAPRLRFDIPAQGLPAALDAYAGATGRGIVVDQALLQGQSAALHGEFTPIQAMRRMLAGSGLQARFTQDGVVAIVRAPQPAGAAVRGARVDLADIPGVLGAGGDFRVYVAQLQWRLRGALCRGPQTRPGDYRMLLKYRVAGDGRLRQLELLGATGLPGRDAAIARALDGLAVGRPPAGMPQPLLTLLEPAGPGADECGRPSGAAVATP